MAANCIKSKILRNTPRKYLLRRIFFALFLNLHAVYKEFCETRFVKSKTCMTFMGAFLTFLGYIFQLLRGKM